MPSLKPKSGLRIHKSSSLILHSSYCWNRWDTYRASSLGGRVIVGCAYFQVSSIWSILSWFSKGWQGDVLQDLDIFIGARGWQRWPATGNLQPILRHLCCVPPPHTWSHTLQSPKSTSIFSSNGLVWSFIYLSRSKLSISIVKFLSSVISSFVKGFSILSFLALYTLNIWSSSFWLNF